MTWTAVALLLLAATTHATWNLLGKRTHPSGGFFLVAVAFQVLWLAPLAVWHHDVVVRIPPQIWLRLTGSGLALAVFFITLAGAYRHGDMSVAYPVARGLPVVGIAVVTSVAGWGAVPTPLGVVGMALVLVGCVLLPMRRFGELRLSHYVNRSGLFALGAAAVTVCFMLIDKGSRDGLEAQLGVDALTAAMVYVPFELVAACAFLAVAVAASRPGRRSLRHVWPRAWRPAAAAGFCQGVSYVLIVTAMGHVDNISYVQAFMQLSILLGALAGIGLLKEPASAPKLAGIALMLGGLLLVALG